MLSKTIRMEKNLVLEIQKIADMYHISFSDFVRKTLEKEIKKEQNSFFYKLKQVPEASKEESDEIMEYLDTLSKEDLEYIQDDELKL